VIEDLPPHPWSSRIGEAGSVVLRAGGNGHVVTGALGVGYVGSWPRSDPWIGWAGHVVGGRVVVLMNRSLDDPRDWLATLVLELEPIGAVTPRSSSWPAIDPVGDAISRAASRRTRRRWHRGSGRLWP
jgi:hypothetical protein